ncbi:MAG TPA: glycosyltransferase family 39 protein [Solirubrobacteraceae bacterium]|jgi:4-amino-4-deoxy-L-arabinose transferase-like glycosyltransferase|nr:glycosyltransferase family 39 protein [Solirubrobacteraceae bacterium]
MSIGDGVRAAARGVSMESAAAAQAQRVPARARERAPIALSLGLSRWTGYAWGAVAATAAFIGMTWWWLTQNHTIPIYDAGNHLEVAFQFRNMIRSGNLLGPFEFVSVYPPLGHLVGTLGAFVGGVNLAAPIIANNLVFVSLLALGSYRTGRLLFGSAAGMLAVIFVLASPLLIENLHVFMLDPPLTALVAVSIWLLLASEDFARADVAACAGLAAGAGMLIKVQFALAIVSLVLIMLLFGGWRNVRGFAIFLAVAAVVGAPWYLDHLSLLSSMLEVASAHPSNTSLAVPPPPGNIPPTLTITNFLWYLWSILNLQLLVPLFLLAAGGTLWMVLTLARGRGMSGGRGEDARRTPDLAPVAGRHEAPPARHGGRRRAGGVGAAMQRHLRLELMIAGFLTWLILTLTPHHDVRYGMPLLAYVAVVATGWIVFLPRAPRYAAIALLVLGVSINTLGVTFGVGRERTIALASPPPSTQQLPDRIILYASTGFLSAGPSRDGDVPGLLEALHRNGVRTVTWSFAQSRLAEFSFEGLLPLARIAGLEAVIARKLEFSSSPEIATLIHEPIAAHAPPTCTRVKEISEVWVNRYETAVTGVWIARFDPAAGKIALYCPTRQPQYYDVGKV